MPIATDLQPWMRRGVTDPVAPEAKTTDAEYQPLIDLINRYAVVLGLGENFRDLAWAKKFGMVNVRGELTGLQGDIERGGVRTFTTQEAQETKRAEELLGVQEAEIGIAAPGALDEFAAPSFPTEPPPEGYKWELNDLNQWVPTLDPFAAREPTRFAAPDGAPSDSYGRTAVWSERLGAWDYPPNWGQPPAGFVSQFEQEQATIRGQEAQQQFGLQQQQAQQEAEFMQWQQGEVERQQRAQLAAQPASWLQYAAYTGEQPAIQPWMIPLMGQQYAGTVAGAPLPGWEGGTDLSQLPELTRPSRQFQARMGPTALAQYQGYQQARTGIRPEETQFRLWAGAPPGGQSQGLSFTR